MHVIAAYTHKQAQEKNNNGDDVGARPYGRAALSCNILAIVLYVVMVIAVVGGGLGFFFLLFFLLNK